MYEVQIKSSEHPPTLFDLEFSADADELFENIEQAFELQDSDADLVFEVVTTVHDLPLADELDKRLEQLVFRLDDEDAKHLFDRACRLAYVCADWTDEQKLIAEAVYEDEGRSSWLDVEDWLENMEHHILNQCFLHHETDLCNIARERFEQGYYFDIFREETQILADKLSSYINWDSFAKDYEVNADNKSWLTYENNNVCDQNNISIERIW